MDQERIDVLLARYLAGALTPEENEELQWAFMANPALRDALQVLLRMREKPPGGIAAMEEQEMLEKGLRRLRMKDYMDKREYQPDEIEEEADTIYHEDAKLRSFPLRRWVAAAAVLILVGAGVVLYRGNKSSVVNASTPVQEKELSTRYGTRSFMELPDGSKMWLNAGSTVKYAEIFTDGKRELTLSGEAFFDVKHDPDHPFIIHTGKLDVKVLGTSFNIKAYPNDSTMETTLIKGKVEIDFKGNPQANIILRPNEKVVVSVKETPVTDSRPVVSTRTNPVYDRRMVAPDPTYRTIIETSWVEDKLVFRNENFSDVTTRLERWYNIHFSFENEKYMHDKLTASFKDQPIKNVMDALQISLGFHYRIDGDTIRIR